MRCRFMAHSRRIQLIIVRESPTVAIRMEHHAKKERICERATFALAETPKYIEPAYSWKANTSVECEIEKSIVEREENDENKWRNLRFRIKIDSFLLSYTSQASRSCSHRPVYYCFVVRFIFSYRISLLYRAGSFFFHFFFSVRRTLF